MTYEEAISVTDGGRMMSEISGAEIPPLSKPESADFPTRDEILDLLYQLEAKLIRMRHTVSEICDIVENWENKLQQRR